MSNLLSNSQFVTKLFSAIIALSLLAACGGGSGESSDTPTQQTSLTQAAAFEKAAKLATGCEATFDTVNFIIQLDCSNPRVTAKNKTVLTFKKLALKFSSNGSGDEDKPIIIGSHACDTAITTIATRYDKQNLSDQDTQVIANTLKENIKKNTDQPNICGKIKLIEDKQTATISFPVDQVFSDIIYKLNQPQSESTVVMNIIAVSVNSEDSTKTEVFDIQLQAENSELIATIEIPKDEHSYNVELLTRNSTGQDIEYQNIAIVSALSDLTATPQSISLNEDTSKNIALSGTSSSGGVLSYSLEESPKHGTYQNGIYTPTPNYFGADSFSFTVSNGQEKSSPAIISININPINDAPTLKTTPLVTGGEGEINVSNISPLDIDSSVVTVIILIDGVASGTFDIPVGTSISPIIMDIPIGSHAISLKYTDGESSSTSVDLGVVDVQAVNQAPTITVMTLIHDFGGGIALQVKVEDSDGTITKVVFSYDDEFTLDKTIFTGGIVTSDSVPRNVLITVTAIDDLGKSTSITVLAL